MSTCVFFFGGYKASQADIDAWVRSAKQQKPNIEFNGFPWTSGPHAGDGPAVEAFKKHGPYHSVVAAINVSGANSIYIVGHSSGCALANAVDKGLKDTRKVALVALDGFRPDHDQRKRPSTQVWGAECKGVKSRNYPSGVHGHKTYHATDCKSKWALHFSLVNAAATDRTVTSIETGYFQCRANLVWL